MPTRTRPLAISVAKALGVVLLRFKVRGSRFEGLEDDAVDDGFNRVVLLLVEAHALGQFDDLAVDASAESLLVERFEFFAELALAAAHDGREDGDTFLDSNRAFARRRRLAHDLGDDLG